jgi:methionyl-tRNA formyltransferase
MFKTISVLVDNDSWILPYAQKLVVKLKEKGFSSTLVRHQNDVPQGDICFFLGCTNIVNNKILQRNSYNLVVHESDLPKGKGFAPVAWQILQGDNNIPVCLIEAKENVDSGNIWLKDYIELNGTELADEWRAKQGEVSLKIALSFITNFLSLEPSKQQGKLSHYPRRSPKDSELDINKSIKEQFLLLRTVDNREHPAFFVLNGCKYRVEIYKDE